MTKDNGNKVEMKNAPNTTEMKATPSAEPDAAVEQKVRIEAIQDFHFGTRFIRAGEFLEVTEADAQQLTRVTETVAAFRGERSNDMGDAAPRHKVQFARRV